MRYAIISDIHSNLEALNAVIDDIDGHNVDDLVCLGDLVGYNANPNECIDIIRERGVRTVMGNHDSVASGRTDPGEFNSDAREAIIWTKEKLSDESREFLQNLPPSIFVDETFLAVHGSVDSTDAYIFGLLDAVWNFKLVKGEGRTNVCFFGHTHIPAIYVENGSDVYAEIIHDIDIKKKARYLVNPGSVGQPRDGDKRAAYVIYDSTDKSISFHRVAYDAELASAKVEGAGLPFRLSRRIKEGW